MIKDYLIGNYESIDFEIDNTGADTFSIRLDRVANFLISDLVIYTDSGRTTPLVADADWAYVTEDEYYTALEVGNSDKTVYSEIQIINSFYQTVPLYCTCNNFGAYTSGQAQTPDYQEITASGSYTIEPNIREAILVIPSSVTTQLTITLVQGEHPCGNASTANRCRVVDESSYSGYHIVTDATDVKWVEDQSTEFIFNSADDLIWASVGWELVYRDLTNLTNTIALTSGNIGGAVAIGDRFSIGGNSDSNLDAGYTGGLDVHFLTDNQYSSIMLAGTNSRFYVNNTTELVGCESSSINIICVKKWHNGA